MKFKDICENAGIETRSYSGRGMYGRNCLGIDSDSDLGLLVSAMLEYVTDSLEDDDLHDAVRTIADAFRDMRTDSMGLGIIVYFPKIKWQHEDVINEQGIRDERGF
jgi:hypothetical protein